MGFKWLPNFVSLLRPPLGLAVFLCALYHQWGWALLFLLLGWLTDWLDGFLASVLSAQSSSGLFLEDFCDFFFSVCAVGGLLLTRQWPWLSLVYIGIPLALAIPGMTSPQASRWHRYYDGMSATVYLAVAGAVTWAYLERGVARPKDVLVVLLALALPAAYYKRHKLRVWYSWLWR